MKKFVITYHTPAEIMKNLGEPDPVEMEKGMVEWWNWADRCGDSLVDLGNPLMYGKRLNSESSGGTKSEISGYSILQAEDMDAVLKLLENHPHTSWNKQCSIEVHEVMPLPSR